jgi:hypothetical protein
MSLFPISKWHTKAELAEAASFLPDRVLGNVLAFLKTGRMGRGVLLDYFKFHIGLQTMMKATTDC